MTNEMAKALAEKVCPEYSEVSYASGAHWVHPYTVQLGMESVATWGHGDSWEEAFKNAGVEMFEPSITGEQPSEDYTELETEYGPVYYRLIGGAK